LRDEHVFVIIYALVASYFAGVMVRLMLTLTPVVCISAAVALSSVLDTYIDPTEPDTSGGSKGESSIASAAEGTTAATPKKAKKEKAAASGAASSSSVGELISDIVGVKTGQQRQKGIFGLDTRLAVIVNACGMLMMFVLHCTWVTSSAYSSPSVVLASHGPNGLNIIDDFREAYYWLRQNTPETSVVMSWWDYGYQIAGMADRPTLVDNNTWNNSSSAPPLQ